MKHAIVLLLFYAGICSAQELVAPAYPGAVKLSGDNPVIFITNDSYEQVTAFYALDLGSGPESESDDGETGKKSWFLYDSWTIGADTPGHGDIHIVVIGVNVDYMVINNSYVELVLDMFSDKVDQNVYNRDDYHNLVDRYGYLANVYFPLVDAEGGKICRSRAIYNKYNEMEKKAEEEQNKYEEDAAININQLLEQGDLMELVEMGKKMMGDYENIHDMSLWEDCLEEMAQEYYTTRISISLKERY